LRFFVNVLAEKVELDNFHVNEREKRCRDNREKEREQKSNKHNKKHMHNRRHPTERAGMMGEGDEKIPQK